eukprot:gene7832-667_t
MSLPRNGGHLPVSTRTEQHATSRNSFGKYRERSHSINRQCRPEIRTNWRQRNISEPTKMPSDVEAAVKSHTDNFYIRVNFEDQTKECQNNNAPTHYPYSASPEDDTKATPDVVKAKVCEESDSHDHLHSSFTKFSLNPNSGKNKSTKSLVVPSLSSTENSGYPLDDLSSEDLRELRVVHDRMTKSTERCAELRGSRLRSDSPTTFQWNPAQFSTSSSRTMHAVSSSQAGSDTGLGFKYFGPTRPKHQHGPKTFKTKYSENPIKEKGVGWYLAEGDEHNGKRVNFDGDTFTQDTYIEFSKRNMYLQFRQLAKQQLEENRYGIECLFRFYAYGLDEKYKEGRLNLSLYNDFQEEVIEDWMNGQLYGLEKFVGFLEYSGFPEENVRPEIKEAMKQYPTLASFKERR